MMSLICLVDHILYQEHFEYVIKKHDLIADNLPILIYVRKIKNRFLFQMKTGYKLELLSEETMRLLESTEQDIDKDKNDENLTKLELLK